MNTKHHNQQQFLVFPRINVFDYNNSMATTAADHHHHSSHHDVNNNNHQMIIFPNNNDNHSKILLDSDSSLFSTPTFNNNNCAFNEWSSPTTTFTEDDASCCFDRPIFNNEEDLYNSSSSSFEKEASMASDNEDVAFWQSKSEDPFWKTAVEDAGRERFLSAGDDEHYGGGSSTIWLPQNEEIKSQNLMWQPEKLAANEVRHVRLKSQSCEYLQNHMNEDENAIELRRMLSLQPQHVQNSNSGNECEFYVVWGLKLGIEKRRNIKNKNIRISRQKFLLFWKQEFFE